MIRKPLVYVAGPYSSDPVANTRRAIEAGMELWRTGEVAVIIPHLSMLADLVRPMPVGYWYDYDRDLLAHCDALLVLPGESRGVKVELADAEDMGMPVFRNGTDLIFWAENRNAEAIKEASA